MNLPCKTAALLALLVAVNGCSGPPEQGRLVEQLRVAVQLEKIPEVVRLLKRGADYCSGSGPERFTPLHRAALQGSRRLTVLLLERARRDGVLPPRVAARDRYGFTPLMWAAGAGRFRIVKLLLEAGADPLLRSPSGNSALHYAVRSRSRIASRAVRLLLEWGADPALTNRSGVDVAAFARHGGRPDLARLVEQRRGVR